MTRIDHLLNVRALALVIAAIWATPSHAGLVISLDNFQATSPTSGTFEVDLSNQGSTTYDVAGFSIELSVAGASGVQFTAVSTNTIFNSYIFDGTGGAIIDPQFAFSSSPFPTTSLFAEDTEWTFLSIPLTPGNSFGLALVSYSITPGHGIVPIIFGLTTSIADPDGNALDFTSQNGSVNTGTVAAVPEPPVLLPAIQAIVLGLSGFGAMRLKQRLLL